MMSEMRGGGNKIWDFILAKTHIRCSRKRGIRKGRISLVIKLFIIMEICLLIPERENINPRTCEPPGNPRVRKSVSGIPVSRLSDFLRKNPPTVYPVQSGMRNSGFLNPKELMMSEMRGGEKNLGFYFGKNTYQVQSKERD